MGKITNYDDLYGTDQSDTDYTAWLKNEGEKSTKKSKPGTSDGGYMSGIASIGNALNDTSDFWWKVINSGKTQADNDKILGSQLEAASQSKINSIAGRRTNDRSQNMAGLDFLDNQRNNASKNANLAGFRNALWSGSKNGTV